MRTRLLAAALAAAGLLSYAFFGGSDDPKPSPTASTAADGRGAHDRLGLTGPALAAAAGAPMPYHDARVAQFLADHPLDAEVRGRLVELAQLQRVTYAPRAPDHVESLAERAERRELREEFRGRVRDIVAALPPSTRAAMRERRVNLVRLAQTIETQGASHD